jgi:HSP20 family protein
MSKKKQKEKDKSKDKETSSSKLTQELSRKVSIPLQKLNQAMDEVLEDLFYGPEDLGFEPDLDLFESDGLLVMEIVLPGIEPEDLFLRVEPDKLILQGELLTSDDFDETEAFISERFYGPFQRIVDLPVDVDPNGTEAFYKDGILRIEMPIDEDAEDYRQGRDIDVS